MTMRKHTVRNWSDEPPKLRLDVQGMVATVQPANDAAAAGFAAFESMVRRRLGFRLGYPILGDSAGSRVESLLAAELRTRRYREFEAEAKVAEPLPLTVPRSQAAAVRKLAKSFV